MSLEKDGCPISVKTWMEFQLLLLRFVHYTNTKINLSCKELNNDELRHNKQMINRRILLGWVLEGRLSRATGNLHFFYFAHTSLSNLSPQHLRTIFSNTHPPPALDQIIHESLSPPNWIITFNFWTNPFWVILLSVTFDLLMHMQNEVKWSCDWQKIVGPIRAQTSQSHVST